MKIRLPDLLFLLIFAGIGIFVYKTPFYRDQFLKLISESACDTPLTYKIGNVDPKFGLTDFKINSAVLAATDIWSLSFGKKLFSQQADAKLTVNFVYDERTALNSQINQMEDKLTTSSADLKARIREYDADVKRFEQKLAEFNAKVAQYNKQGSVTREIYNQLLSEQKQLQTEGDALNARARQLNLAAKNYNSNLGELNKNIQQFNDEISKRPEEGLYDPNNNTITIYFAANEKELVHTLAHEFGHYLSIDHVSEPTAIMYQYSSTLTDLTDEDKQQLDWVCREQPIPVLWLNSLQELVRNFRQKNLLTN